jgi:hypothetical protein
MIRKKTVMLVKRSDALIQKMDPACQRHFSFIFAGGLWSLSGRSRRLLAIRHIPPALGIHPHAGAWGFLLAG